MSLLVFMLVSQNGDDISGFKYEFVDIIVAGYFGQDNVQVAAIIPHEYIPYIHQKNEGWVSTMGMHVEGWINTEAGTGKGQLDTLFSYVNTKL
eukprot:5924841-Ditylum_brightwellii.AAC.1